MFKKGDTLIEVMLAIGIFSMVAISVVAVLSSSSAGAETALETSLAREEIDTQADALRFIQSAATADNTSASSDFYNLWDRIISYTAHVDETDQDYTNILQYAPTRCSDVYDYLAGVSSYTPFIINTQALGPYTNGTLGIDDVVVTGVNSRLVQTQTYPHLIFGSGAASNSDTANLSATIVSNQLYQAAGIFVIAVADPDTTEVIAGADRTDPEGRASAYYDFYIRTCWYGINANQASTISTVIRLHNPNVVHITDFNASVSEPYFDSHLTTFDANGGRFIDDGATAKTTHCSSANCVFPSAEPTWQWHVFDGWQSADNPAAGIFAPGTVFAPSDLGYNFLAVWREIPLITIDANGGTFWSSDGNTSLGSTKSYRCASLTSCTISSDNPTRSGYEFQGYATTSSATTASYFNGNTFNPEVVTARTFYAVWRERNETINVKLTWSYSTDYDSHVVGQKSDDSTFHAYYGNKIGSDISGLTIAQLDQDCTGSCTTENFVINTLGGKTYYYYVFNFSGKTSAPTGATVTVSGPYIGTHTFYSNNATGSGGYWNVFSYQNGKLVTPQQNCGTTFSSVQNTSYSGYVCQ